MIDDIETAGHLWARATGRAVPRRATLSIQRDPLRAFGFAAVRIVGEDRPQAVAFGPLDALPSITYDWNALARDTTFLEPLSDALEDYINDAGCRGAIPRIWFCHPSALAVFQLIGLRYRTNRSVSEKLRRLGAVCCAFLEEYQVPGQQAVVVATSLAAEHAFTGEPPARNRHPGVLCVWLDPPAGTTPEDVLDLSARRWWETTGSMLTLTDEAANERDRRIAKSPHSDAAAARRRIEDRLVRNVEREWRQLLELRDAVRSLGLAPPPGLAALAQASRERLSFSLANPRTPRSRPNTLSRYFGELKFAAEIREEAEVCGDRLVRERAKRAGRAFTAQVVSADQPRHNRHPCTLVVVTSQTGLRVRIGTRLQSVRGDVQGRVTAKRENGAGDAVVDIRLTKGVRTGTRPDVGTVIEWVDAVPMDLQRERNRIYAAMGDRGVAPGDSETLPAPTPRTIAGSLLLFCEQLQRAV